MHHDAAAEFVNWTVTSLSVWWLICSSAHLGTDQVRASRQMSSDHDELIEPVHSCKLSSLLLWRVHSCRLARNSQSRKTPHFSPAKGCRTNIVANVRECAHGQIYTPENGFSKFLHQNVATVQGFHLVQKLCDSILEMYEMTEVPKWIAELVIWRLRIDDSDLHLMSGFWRVAASWISNIRKWKCVIFGYVWGAG